MSRADPLRYKRAFNEYGESPKALRWANYKTAAVRYRQLVADLDIKNKSILDAGCGMGDILPFLYAKAIDFEYLGVDIEPNFIDIAKKRYDGHQFKVANPFTDDFSETFNIVLSCGAMNANIPNWLGERKKMIAKLFKLSNEALAFSMAGNLGRQASETDNTAYAKTEDILEFCLTLTAKIIIRNHYSPHGFTIAMFK